MLKPKRSALRALAAFAASGVFVAVAVVVFVNRQTIADQIAVWSYTPSAEIAAINDRAAFTSQGTRIFYATKPTLARGDEFNQQCPRRETASPIVGCYTSSDTIHLFDVTNTELDGVKEVTAAHELLHAVWYRMSDAERDVIGTRLAEAYAHIDDNAALRQRMAYYQRTEPKEFLNELHSILATEVATLPAVLEKHYARFFQDRQKVIALHRAYSGTFTALYEKAQSLQAELETLSDEIGAEIEAYRKNETTLSTDITTFNTKAESGDFSSMATFQAQRAALLGRAQSLEAARESINQKIERHNTLRSEHNALASKIDGLNKSIDSYESLQKGPSIQ